MQIINIHDINLEGFKKLPVQGTFSTTYSHEDTCYKLLDGLYYSERRDLYQKLLRIEADNIKIDNALFPQALIMDGNDLKGYTTPYISDAVNVSEKFYDSPEYLNINEFFKCVIKSDKILRQIHQNGIICQDLTFENILVDSNGGCYFIDFDGCSYKDMKTLFISRMLSNFVVAYRKERIEIIANLDRISMMLSFFNIIFGKPIYCVNSFEYKKMSKHINTLNNLEPYVEMLLDKKNPIGYVPYLDEKIDIDDNYFIKLKK